MTKVARGDGCAAGSHRFPRTLTRHARQLIVRHLQNDQRDRRVVVRTLGRLGPVIVLALSQQFIALARDHNLPAKRSRFGASSPHLLRPVLSQCLVSCRGGQLSRKYPPSPCLGNLLTTQPTGVGQPSLFTRFAASSAAGDEPCCISDSCVQPFWALCSRSA